VIVFDLATQTPTQTLFRGSTQLGLRPLSTVFFNVSRQALLIATNVIGLLEHDAADPMLSGLTSHSHHVNIAIYNQLFHVVGQQVSLAGIIKRMRCGLLQSMIPGVCQFVCRAAERIKV